MSAWEVDEVSLAAGHRPEPGRPAAGAGLGLAIVRAIAKAHGGHASARNRDGRGADVWMELPS